MNSSTHTSKYPNAIYRVSLRAIIKNKEGEVLLVKEKGSHWTLPGGGIDHGETDQDALQRELREEADIDQAFISRLVKVDSYWIEEHQHYQFFVLYEVVFTSTLRYSVGTDSDAVKFIDIQTLKNSKHRSEKWVYKWLMDLEEDSKA